MGFEHISEAMPTSLRVVAPHAQNHKFRTRKNLAYGEVNRFGKGVFSTGLNSSAASPRLVKYFFHATTSSPRLACNRFTSSRISASVLPAIRAVVMALTS